MKESIIKSYLEDEMGALSLKTFLGGIRNTSELRQGENLFSDLAQDYEVTIDHLKRVCDDYLVGDFDADDVTAIAFFLMGSDHFVWDRDSEGGAVVAELINDWVDPEIAFPINRQNMRIISRGLAEGIYDPKALSMNRIED